MSHHARTARRMFAGMVAGALALSVTPILGFTGVASAADPLPPVAEPIGAGNFCEDVPAGEPFTDVNGPNEPGPNDPSYDEIVCLVATGITEGTNPAGTLYEPNATITRRQMALFLKRVADEADRLEVDNSIEELPAPTVPPFTDTATQNQEVKDAISQISQAGVAEGFPDGSYRPNSLVSRRQMAAFIDRLYTFLTGGDLEATGDYFDDDDGEDADSEEHINSVAGAGIFQGDASGSFRPVAGITRRQMANVNTRTLQVLMDDDFITKWVDPATQPNQTFAVTPSAASTDDVGASKIFNVSNLDGSPAVDIALIPCDEVIRNGAAISFGDDEGDAGEADDLGSTPVAHINQVNNANIPPTDHVDDASVVNGQLSFRITSDTAGCVVAVVFDDVDDQDDLDLDTGDRPTEPFGVTGNLTFIAIEAVDATPETDTNPFGTMHTITVQLRDAEGAAVPALGRSIRYQVYRNPLICDPDGDVVGGLTVAVTGSGATNAGGSVALVYTGPADPTAGDDADVEDCIVTWFDADFDGVRDTGELDDVVAKTWSDDPPSPASVTLTPASDTNLVSTNHTVVATLRDQYGNVVAGQNILFEVHREGASNPISFTQVSTNASGQASLTYGGPSGEVDDVIIVCRDTDSPGNGCDAPATFDPEGATLDDGEVDAFAVKRWFVLQASPDGGTDACVVAADTTNDTIDVEDADVNRRLRYDSGDQFRVDGSPVTMQAFEAALSAGDRLTYAFQPTVGNVSTFNLANDTDCTA